MAFEEFFQAINLDKEEKELVKTHHDFRESLRNIFSLNGHPSDFLSGSYARNTIIRPPHDVDFLICFDPKNQDNITLKAEGAEVFHNFVIENIRKNRRKFGENLQIKSQRRSINVRETGSSFGFDIVPSFPSNSMHEIADKEDNIWINTNPKEFDRLLSEKNQKLKGWLIRLIKIFKAWNVYKKKPLKSFFVEVFLFDLLHHQPVSYSKIVLSLLKSLKNNIYNPLYDPAIPNSRVDYFFTTEMREEAEKHLDKSMQFAEQAYEFENQGKQQKAIRLWKKIFGPEFPDPIENNKKKTGSSSTGAKRKSQVKRHAKDLKFGRIC